MEAYALFTRSKEKREARCDEEDEEDIGCPSESELSMSSSSSEVDLADDASSSGSTGNFEMSSLMTQLPLKRGLSKFFDGKSQSFGSLAAVGGLEDLPKPPRKRLKASWSRGASASTCRTRAGGASRGRTAAMSMPLPRPARRGPG